MSDSGVPHLNGKSNIPPTDALPVWLVSEYVYSVEGQFLGILRQRHVMEPRPDGSIRVTVSCDPSAELEGQSLAILKGDWVFDLGREGDELVYYGPDITGKGRSWGELTLTTSGEWKRGEKASFKAAAFRTAAFSIVLDIERQLVGTTFNQADKPVIPLIMSSQPGLTVAKTIGIAAPEYLNSDWPTFQGEMWPGNIAERWRGTWQRYDSNGQWVEAVAVERRYTSTGWVESTENDPAHDQLDLAHQSVRRFGWAVETTPFRTTEQHYEQLEVLDAEREAVLGLRRIITHSANSAREVGVDVLSLRADS